VDLDEVLAATFSLVAPHLTERQRRLLFGAAARALGYGGVSRVARLAAASRPTVRRGAAELDQPADPQGRIRQHEGPKRLRERDPGLLQALDRLVDPDTRGDPESPLRWTCKSTRELAQALTRQGHPVSDDTVGRLLKQQGYRLQRTVKTLEGAQHADRDAQFRYLNEQARAHLGAGQPVVSVDTKKKELVGRYANGGREWHPPARPSRSTCTTSPTPSWARRSPTASMTLGVTPAGCVSGPTTTPPRSRSPPCGAGGSRSAASPPPGRAATGLCRRRRQQRLPGQGLEDRAGPAGGRDRASGHRLSPATGDSKWNRIEHRLFSAISMNWRGRPLEDHEVIVELIAATTTHTGLRVRAELDRGRYPLGVKVRDQELAAVPLVRHEFHGEWNYTIQPAA
jgi:DDE family transposase